MVIPTVSEEWRVVEGWPDYEVSNLGRVRRARPSFTVNPRNGKTYLQFPAGLLLKQSPKAKGYLKVNFSADSKQQTLSVSIIVCRAFHGPRPSPRHEAAHWNGNNTDNCASNLRWATHIENNKDDKLRHGRTNRGERHPLHKITEDDVIEIRRLLASGVKQKAIAQRFMITQPAVSQIKRYVHWWWVK